MAVLLRRGFDSSHKNMANVLPATVGAQGAILITIRVDYSHRLVTKVLPATGGAQIAILISKSVICVCNMASVIPSLN